MYNHRPSILHRPLKARSQVTDESIDKQYEKEQEKWQQKAAMQSQTQERLMKSIYPMPEDKIQAQQDWRQTMEQHQLAKETERRRQEEVDTVFSKPGFASTYKDERPWLATTYNYNAAEELVARKRYEQEVAEDNRQVMLERAIARAHDQQVEQEVARNTVAEDCYWNLGASRDSRWLPPERRVPTAQPVPERSQPVWAWSQDAPQPVQLRPSTTGPRPPPYAVLDDASCVIQQQPVQRRPDHTHHDAPPYKGQGAGYSTVPDLQQPRQQPCWATWDDAASNPLERPQTASSVRASSQQRPWATDDDTSSGQVVGQQRWASKASEREYPWSWKS